MKFTSLRKQWLIGLLLPIIVLFGLFGFLTHQTQADFHKTSTINFVNTTIDQTTNDIEDHYSNIERVIQLTASNVAANLNHSDFISFIDRIAYETLQSFPEVFTFYISFEIGQLPKNETHRNMEWVDASYMWDDGMCVPFYTDWTMSNLDTYLESWYYPTMERNSFYWSEPYYDTDLGQPMISALSTIKYSNGTACGVIGMDVTLNYLENLLQSIDLGEGGYPFLIERSKGLVVIHEKLEFTYATSWNSTVFLGGFTIVDWIHQESNNSDLAAILNAMQDGNNGYSKFEDTFIFYRNVDSINYSIGYVYQESEIFGQLVILRQNYMIFSSLCLIVIVGIIIIFSEQITTPLVLLSKQVNAIASGDRKLTIKPKFKKQDEISILTTSFIQMIANITEKEQALQDLEEKNRNILLEKLQQTEEVYQSIFGATTDAIFIMSTKGEIVECNPQACRMYGYSHEEFIHLSGKDIVHPDYASYFKEFLDLAPKGKDIFRESKNIRKDGSTFPIEVTGGEIQYQGELHLLSMVRDISFRKEVERAVIAGQRLAAMGELASGVAHDFNNSLQAILGNVELALLEDGLTPEVQDYLCTIRNSVTDASSRTRILHRFGVKSDSQMEFKSVNLNQTIEDVLAQARPLWKDEQERLGIQIRIIFNPTTIPLILGNLAEIRTVIFNLVKNGIQAMSKGGTLQLDTGIINSSVFVKIADTGDGMSDENKSRIFEPFFTTKGFARGMGLGLNIAYSIIKDHKGQIVLLSSTLGEGTVFQIEFPIPTIQLVEEENESEVFTINQDHNSIRILWVDDEAMIRKSGQLQLQKLGFHTDISENGRHALEMLARDPYDLIITDLGMPDMSGWQLADEIFARNISNLKIAVITGWGDDISDQEKIEHHVDYVLTKPVELHLIKKLIQKISEDKSAK